MPKKNVQKSNVVLEALKIDYIGVEDVKPNEYNPNRQSAKEFELLCRSMREDGFTQPIIVHKETGQIVDGEHRWRAAQAIGLKRIPVVYVSMTDEQRRIATLRHNRARGTEDIELSAEVLRDLEKLGALDWAQDSLMLSDDEIKKLMDDVPVAEALAGEDFNEAWEPQKVDYTEGTSAHTKTVAVQETVRDRQQRLEGAKSDYEREQIKKETSIVKLILEFTQEEYELFTARFGTSRHAENIVNFLKSQNG